MEASWESKCQQVYWGREQVIKSIIIIFLPDLLDLCPGNQVGGWGLGFSGGSLEWNLQ